MHKFYILPSQLVSYSGAKFLVNLQKIFLQDHHCICRLKNKSADPKQDICRLCLNSICRFINNSVNVINFLF